MSGAGQSPGRARDYRSQVIACLRLFAGESGLSEPSAQAGFTLNELNDLNHRAPEEDALPRALCKLWFDEVYLPSERYLDALKGDLCVDALRAFEACFSEDELEALSRFHRFLELRLDMLSRHLKEGPTGRSRFWEHVRKDARNTLGLLVPGDQGQGTEVT